MCMKIKQLSSSQRSKTESCTIGFITDRMAFRRHIQRDHSEERGSEPLHRSGDGLSIGQKPFQRFPSYFQLILGKFLGMIPTPSFTVMI
jgi:hypothetical protein